VLRILRRQVLKQGLGLDQGAARSSHVSYVAITATNQVHGMLRRGAQS
jgi:hypothetical protein